MSFAIASIGSINSMDTFSFNLSSIQRVDFLGLYIISSTRFRYKLNKLQIRASKSELSLKGPLIYFIPNMASIASHTLGPALSKSCTDCQLPYFGLNLTADTNAMFVQQLIT
ncbi:hypothetical protein CHS0354_018058 [Potamilus streckersoni]|uniref:Uncharacterized protein n=1 Tax=Potamilus streckersoni TaxID=2493646 RepID=A0AAE0RXP7_9BIVA|nr:hypothetical protein CHS0354_018058 [Potamilus streckersoni]